MDWRDRIRNRTEAIEEWEAAKMGDAEATARAQAIVADSQNAQAEANRNEYRRESGEEEKNFNSADSRLSSNLHQATVIREAEYELETPTLRKSVKKKKDGRSANGGKREGAGRKVRAQKMTNYNKALKILDDHIEDALYVLIEGLSDKNKYYRFKCAELMLKKSLPDKKATEHTGKNGGPIEVTDVSAKQIEAAVAEVEAIIDEKIRKGNMQNRILGREIN